MMCVTAVSPKFYIAVACSIAFNTILLNFYFNALSYFHVSAFSKNCLILLPEIDSL